MVKILLVDDETKFRESLAERLRLRDYDVIDVGSGEEAIKKIRADRDIDVVVLDLKMPGMGGEQALNEIKSFRPEVQVVILTGHGSYDSATTLGKLDAFSYATKPVQIEELVAKIESARKEKVYASARLEVHATEKGSPWKWLVGSHGSRPIFIMLGIVLFLILVLMPLPSRLLELVSTPKSAPEATAEQPDLIAGFAGYRKMEQGETIAEYYSRKNGLKRHDESGEGTRSLTPEETGNRAMIMLGAIVVAALFWASGAAPVGVAALLIGVVMYFGGVLKPDDVAKAFAKDAVFFIFGVLALSRAIGKTGLDRRIGLLLLAPARNLKLLLLVFLPLLSVTCSFVSEHALVAFTMPLFIMVYTSTMRASGIRCDKALMVIFALSLCFAANCGGPGSPAAGGRNAIMIGILGDYGYAPSFLTWVKYGLPLVPVLAVCVGLYFLLVMRKKVRVPDVNVSAEVRQASKKIGPMVRDEYVTAAVLIGVVALWIGASDSLGMGGPVILGLVVLNITRVLKWRDIAGIHWEVVFLYAGASAIGKGLASTGGALYLADGFVSMLPDIMKQGEGLAVATSIFTGVTTNFMSDGATVAAIGPISVPMAQIADVHPWMVGFATAFASSFAHMLIIGTPSNALVFAMSKDPVTGEQLVTLVDFLKHGAAVLVISLVVLWVWAFFGYWSWIGFPPV